MLTALIIAAGQVNSANLRNFTAAAFSREAFHWRTTSRTTRRQ